MACSMRPDVLVTRGRRGRLDRLKLVHQAQVHHTKWSVAGAPRRACHSEGALPRHSSGRRPRNLPGASQDQNLWCKQDVDGARARSVVPPERAICAWLADSSVVVRRQRRANSLGMTAWALRFGPNCLGMTVPARALAQNDSRFSRTQITEGDSDGWNSAVEFAKIQQASLKY